MGGELASNWWAFVVLGLLAGVLSGALGLGSGTLLIPVMVLLLGMPQKSAQGTALAVMVPMALLGAFRYWHNPDIEVRPTAVGLLVLGALGGALIGTELAGRLPGATLRKFFAVYLVVVAAKMLLTPLGPKAPPIAPGPAGETPTQLRQDLEVSDGETSPQPE